MFRLARIVSVYDDGYLCSGVSNTEGRGVLLRFFVFRVYLFQEIFLNIPRTAR